MASDYGWALIVEHSLITAMLTIAGINCFWLLPRLGDGTARLSQMRLAILLECVPAHRLHADHLQIAALIEYHPLG